MKSTVKRIITLTTAIALLILSTAVLSGCYLIKSGKMSWIEGTYKLRSYGGDVDRLAERGIEMYVVIRSDGTGYYAYKDNNTDPYISEIKCRFTQDTEEPDKYSYVEINFSGTEYEKFGIYAQWLELGTTLTCHDYIYEGNIFEGTYGLKYTITAIFERVDRATDLEHVHEVFTDAAMLPYDAKRYDSTYKLESIIKSDGSRILSSALENPLVYALIDFDFIKGTAKIYGMNKSDGQAHVDEVSGLTVTCDGSDFLISDGHGNNFLLNRTDTDLVYSIDATATLHDESVLLRFSHAGDMTDEQITDWIDLSVNIYLDKNDTTE